MPIPCFFLLGPESGRGLWAGASGRCSVAQGAAELSRRRRQVRAPAREPRLQLPGAGGLRALPAGACPPPAPCPLPCVLLCSARGTAHVSLPAQCTPPLPLPTTRMSRLCCTHPPPTQAHPYSTPACGSLALCPRGPPLLCGSLALCPRGAASPAGPVQPLGSRVSSGTEWTAPPLSLGAWTQTGTVPFGARLSQTGSGFAGRSFQMPFCFL